MAEKDSGEKTESPTIKRRDDARKEGQVAFSKETSSVVLLGGFLLLLYFSGAKMMDSFAETFIFAFRNIDVAEFDIPAIVLMFEQYNDSSLLVVLSFFGVAFFLGLAGSVAQVGLRFSAKPIQPNFGKLSILKGLQRMFSKQAVNELIKSLFKIGLIGYVGYYTFIESLEEISNLIDLDTTQIIAQSGDLISLLVFRLFLIFLALGMLDFAFQRWDHEQKLKMSKQELKEEMKQSEGDPVLKARIRQIQQQLSQSRMMQEVPTADVIVTNPTHFAIALKYDRTEMAAPKVVAKGSDHMAHRIIEIGKENKIIVYENAPVARGLYFQVEIGDNVPEAFYKVIAEILAFVYKTKKKKRK